MLLAITAAMSTGACASTETGSTSSTTRPATVDDLPYGPVAVLGDSGYFVSDREDHGVLVRIEPDGSRVLIADLPLGRSTGIGTGLLPVGDQVMVVGMDDRACSDADGGCDGFDVLALFVDPDGTITDRHVLSHVDRSPDEGDGAQVIGTDGPTAWVTATNSGVLEVDRDGVRPVDVPRPTSTPCVIDGQVTSAATAPDPAGPWVVRYEVTGGPEVSVPTVTSDLSGMAATPSGTRFVVCTPDGYSVIELMGTPVFTYRPPVGWSEAHPPPVESVRPSWNQMSRVLTLGPDGWVTVWQGDVPIRSTVHLGDGPFDPMTLSFKGDARDGVVVACVQQVSTEVDAPADGTCATGTY